MLFVDKWKKKLTALFFIFHNINSNDYNQQHWPFYALCLWQLVWCVQLVCVQMWAALWLSVPFYVIIICSILTNTWIFDGMHAMLIFVCAGRLCWPCAVFIFFYFFAFFAFRASIDLCLFAFCFYLLFFCFNEMHHSIIGKHTFKHKRQSFER